MDSHYNNSTSSAQAGKCTTYMYVKAACDCTYSFNKLTTDIAVAESSPVVGSSRNTISGDMISSIPMLVHFFSPLETPLKISVPT